MWAQAAGHPPVVFNDRKDSPQLDSDFVMLGVICG